MTMSGRTVVKPLLWIVVMAIVATMAITTSVTAASAAVRAGTNTQVSSLSTEPPWAPEVPWADAVSGWYLSQAHQACNSKEFRLFDYIAGLDGLHDDQLYAAFAIYEARTSWCVVQIPTYRTIGRAAWSYLYVKSSPSGRTSKSVGQTAGLRVVKIDKRLGNVLYIETGIYVHCQTRIPLVACQGIDLGGGYVTARVPLIPFYPVRR